jgi:hypothetical protein
MSRSLFLCKYSAIPITLPEVAMSTWEAAIQVFKRKSELTTERIEQ